MNRREFIQYTGLLGLGSHASTLFAAPASTPRFLVVFLRGGYDAANLLVPNSDFYREVRPDIAISRPGTASDSALALNSDWSLHPALQDSVYPLYQKGEALFIPFAGTHDDSRSHFETQDRIESGMGENTGAGRSGFLNRLAGVLQGGNQKSMAFTAQIPLIFQGSVAIPNTSLKQMAKGSLDSRQSSLIASMYKNTPMANSVDEGMTVREKVKQEMAAEMEAANRDALSTKGFQLEASRMARFMREEVSLGFVEVGGWDTHVGQGAATGPLANRFEELGRGLASFAQEMGPAWRNTTVVVISEFGRTFRQNGNKGTDHGHGTVYWVLGGSVRGGRIAGEQVPVSASTLYQNRDYVVKNEYRAVLGGLLARQFGLNSSQLDKVFPGAQPVDLGLV